MRKISLMREKFENEQTGKQVEGITIIIDGELEEFLGIIREKIPCYENNVEIIYNALIKGLEIIKKDVE